jgi:phosphatidylinositol glycan class Z
MTSFLTGALGDYLGDAVAAAVGLEHTDAEFSKRAEAAFKHADADGSGALDFGETYAACVAVPGLKHLSEARAREIFRRFDEDDSGSLDVEEFKKLAALLRSAHALDQMPGVIYCGGRLMNPRQNPAVAQAARLKEIYSKPYVPRSVLAKAIAKPTVRRRVVYGGVDLENLEALTDDDETIEGVSHRRARSSETRGDAKKRRRRRSSRGDTGLSRFKKTSWSVGALETTYVLLVILRALCAVLGTGYIHPDEYHQTVEIGARDVLSVAASPRAWEFDSAAPTRSVAGHVLAAGASFRVWRFLARFDRNVVQVAKAMLAGAAGGCEKAALARGFAAGLRQLESKLFRDTVREGDDGETPRAFVLDDALDDTLHVSPLVIFLAPRVFAFCASLMVDLAASRAARAAYWAQSPKKSSASKAQKRARRGEAHQEKSFSGAARVSLHARLFVASAWPAVTLLVRPLTNAAECVLVSCLLCLVCAPTVTEGLDDDDEGVVFQSELDVPEKAEKTKKSRRARNSLTRAAFRAGAVTALGTWSRFTFPLFAAPLGALLVVRAARAESRLLSPYGQRVARCARRAGRRRGGLRGLFRRRALDDRRRHRVLRRLRGDATRVFR